MADLFCEILQVRKIELLARVAVETELENEDRKIFLSLINELSSELAGDLGKKEMELKSLYRRGFMSKPDVTQ